MRSQHWMLACLGVPLCLAATQPKFQPRGCTEPEERQPLCLEYTDDNETVWNCKHRVKWDKQDYLANHRHECKWWKYRAGAFAGDADYRNIGVKRSVEDNDSSSDDEGQPSATQARRQAPTSSDSSSDDESQPSVTQARRQAPTDSDSSSDDESQPSATRARRQTPTSYATSSPLLPNDTRCNPQDFSKVQVFRHGWYPALTCPRPNSCTDMLQAGRPARAACDNGDGTFTTPDFYDWPDVMKRGAAQTAEDPLHFDSRCEPRGGNYVEGFNGTQWTYVYSCPVDSRCLDLHGIGACEVGDGTFFIPAAARIQPGRDTDSDDDVAKRQVTVMTTPDPHSFHSWDTRCNPQNLTEVQRYDGTLDRWVLHFVCPFQDSCIDVVGIGACYMGMNHYLLPAANNTISRVGPLPEAPIASQTKCDIGNSSSVLGWTVNGWAPVAECIMNLVCMDFKNADMSDAGFAVCVLPQDANSPRQHGPVWLPWTPGSAPVVKRDGTMAARTICRNKRELLHLDGVDWVHDKTCQDGWECRSEDEPPYIAGCYSTGLSKLKVYNQYMGISGLDDPNGKPASKVQRRQVNTDSDSSDDETQPTGPVGDNPSFGWAPKYGGMHARRLAREAGFGGPEACES